MKRFFTLSFLLTSFVLFGQNLIPDGSAENFVECPSTLGNVETYLSGWQSFRGSPDYWNSCSENPLLGWDNSLGFQEPRTGNGYLGLFTFRRNPTNSREYIGVELTEPLMIGEEYYLTFYVSRGHQFNAFNLASNNIGALFMTENTLNNAELGPTPNFSSFNELDIVEDTLNWVEMSYQFIADSAYEYIAFGNFFDDNLTDTLRIGGEPDGNVTSYYYFDDFCLTTSPDGCDFTNSTIDRNEVQVALYPNPCQNSLFIEHELPIGEILIYTVQGELLDRTIGNGEQQLKLEIELQTGVYLIVIHSKEQKATKRFVVSN